MEWIRGPVVGRGSTATVSLAITRSGEFYAVKSTEFSSSAFLQREESISSNLSSPYIIKYIGSDSTREGDKLMYNLLMEYASGGSIHDLIRNSGGKLPEQVIRSYTRQILKGLMYLHEGGIVHCDLKSQNVMIGGENVKIADLGCAKRAVENVEFSGTPAFMSPEVARGEEQSFAADVWALGCLVIEMATGFSPWPELNDVVAAIYKIGFTEESPEIPEWLSEKGKDFLSKCLRRDPKQRWAVGELLQHPFLDDDCGLSSSSPITVLDQGTFWDSCVQLNHDDPFGNSWSLCDRIKKLAGAENSGEPEWVTATEGWIEVRGKGEEDANSVEATSAVDQEDSLFLEYSSTHFYSLIHLFPQDNIILYYYHHLHVTTLVFILIIIQKSVSLAI